MCRLCFCSQVLLESICRGEVGVGKGLLETKDCCVPPGRQGTGKEK